MDPKVYIVSATHIEDGMGQFLNDIGAHEWGTDAASDAEELTEFAARLCYMSFDNSLNANLTSRPAKSNEEYIQGSIIGHKHGSVLEHAHVGVLFHNITRVATHEQVRHRAGTAFSQESGRYVRVKELRLWRPTVVHSSPEATAIFNRAEQQALENYKALEEAFNIDSQPFAKKKEMTSAMRRILPEGRSTNILITANHRAWRNMIEQRTSHGAEEEIDMLFDQVATLLHERFPAIYGDWDGASFTHSKV